MQESRGKADHHPPRTTHVKADEQQATCSGRLNLGDADFAIEVDSGSDSELKMGAATAPTPPKVK